MIDLHVHMDGSVRLQTMIELAKEQGVSLPTYDIEELKEFFVVSDVTKPEYLKRCELTQAVLQSRRAIRRVVSEIVWDLEAQGLLYAEIRVVPQHHIMRGLSQRQVVDAALEGLKYALESCKQIKVNLILCTMRGADAKDNFETVVEAANHMGLGVVGMDIIGDEFTYRNEMYEEQFRLLREEHIPFTVHAGVLEADSIRQILDYGASRIGHGVRALEDADLMETLKEIGIVMEMCPSSNLQTGAVKSLDEHPIRAFFDAGVKVAVGTNDLTICNTTLEHEYTLLHEHLGFTKEEIYQMNLNAIDGAFISSYEKRQLKKRVKEKFFDETIA